MARVKYYDQASHEWKYADAALNMKGKDGYTPQKGIDYFTEEDVRELTENVLDQGVLTYNEQELTEEQKAQARENIGIDQISFDKLTEDLDADGFRITNLPLPQSGSEPATKEFVENFTIEGSTYVATDDGEGNVVIRPYLADEDELVFKSHIQNQNNPHGVTAAQVGARPDTWTPTAEEVGAAIPEAVNSAKTAAVTEAKTFTNTQITDRVVYGKGKNLLKRTITGYNSVGIVATVNPDGSVTLNGTSTNSTRVPCGTAHLEGGKTYVINGRPTGGEVDDYRADLRDSTGSTTLATDAGAGATYTPQADMDVLYIIRVGAGAVFTGQTFYPMIRLATETDDTYEPYYEGLMESVSKSQVVNNFTTTEPGFVADARAVKILNDNIEKISHIREFSPGQTVDITFGTYRTAALVFSAGSVSKAICYIFSNGYLSPLSTVDNVSASLSDDYKTITITNNNGSGLYAILGVLHLGTTSITVKTRS